MGLFTYLKSTILSKFVMAVTGVIIVAFVIGHTVGNMQIFLGKDTYNQYAYFLQSLGELLWIIRIVLILSLVFHVITSIKLKLHNVASTPQKYEVKRYVKAKLTSRTMIWTGIMIFAFIAYHLMHLTLGITDPKNFGEKEYVAKNSYFMVKAPHGNSKVMIDGDSYFPVGKILYERHDVYYAVVKGFQNPAIALFYIVGVILMGFHLSHAIQSMFQTLGINHPHYNKCLRRIGPALATIIVICLISIPIASLLRLVGGNII